LIALIEEMIRFENSWLNNIKADSTTTKCKSVKNVSADQSHLQERN